MKISVTHYAVPVCTSFSDNSACLPSVLIVIRRQNHFAYVPAANIFLVSLISERRPFILIMPSSLSPGIYETVRGGGAMKLHRQKVTSHHTKLLKKQNAIDKHIRVDSCRIFRIKVRAPSG